MCSRMAPQRGQGALLPVRNVAPLEHLQHFNAQKYLDQIFSQTPPLAPRGFPQITVMNLILDCDPGGVKTFVSVPTKIRDLALSDVEVNDLPFRDTLNC